MAELADNIVFRALKQELPSVQVPEPKQLNLTIGEASRLIARTQRIGLVVSLRARIQAAYGVDDATADLVAQKAAHELNAALQSVSQRSWRCTQHLTLRTELLTAFTELDMVGDTPDQLLEYVQHCWAKYREHPDDIVPSGAVVQSSGFGKSQVLYGLARKTCKNEELGIRVLYTCNRMTESSGFPATTTNLRDWLFAFSRNDLVSRLKALYHYAAKNWSTVGYEWLELFTNDCTDESVTSKLEQLLATSKSTEEPTSTDQGRKIVVLAVDSASGLLQQNIDGVDYTVLLRRAPTQVNKAIREAHPEGGMFAIFADRDLAVAGLPLSNRQEQMNVLPPFVLTHNQDAYWRRYRAELGHAGDDVAAYKAVVTADDIEVSSRSLLSMGRPLWGSELYAKLALLTYDYVGQNCMEEVVNLASCKLLVGIWPTRSEGYTNSTRRGVAAALCRLGVQLRSWPWSTVFVTHLMAFLSDAKRTLIYYPSEPILALGATRIWYSLGPRLYNKAINSFSRDTLSNYILPKLGEMLRIELEVAHPGDMVARILLLLAMDTSVLIESEGSEHYLCKFRGQFVSVPVFLKALGGVEPPVMGADTTTPGDPATVARCKAWQNKWENWKCGFCQFVELNEAPTEDLLWVLLGRRAAAVLPGDDGGADLLIPMFNGDKVSFIVVQVEGVKKRSKTFPASVTEEMRPSHVFAEGNPLSQKAPGEVIRVYMNLQEPPLTSVGPDRYFFCRVDTDGDVEKAEEEAFSLCICSLSPRSLELDGTIYPVVTEAVGAILVGMMTTQICLPRSSGERAPGLTQGIIGLPTLTHEALLEEISRVRPEASTQTSD
jgi:hypothetical protein